MPVDPSYMMQVAQDYQNSDDPRFDWSEGDWQQELRRLLNVPSRSTRDMGPAGPGQERWEHLFNGEWMNDQQFNDPAWRRNVYDPWAQGVEDEFRNKWEDTSRRKRERGGGLADVMTQGGPRNRRSAGPMGTYSGGGGSGGQPPTGSSSMRRRYDPSMIARLIGG